MQRRNVDKKQPEFFYSKILAVCRHFVFFGVSSLKKNLAAGVLIQFGRYYCLVDWDFAPI